MRNSSTRSRLRAVAAASLLGSFALSLLGAPGAGAADSSVLLTWNRLAPRVSPPARLHGAMAYDAATGTTVLFGGRSGNQVLGDTWTWDGSTWTGETPATSPPPLESASMAYDNIGHQILLFGGLGGDGNASGATWSWNGTTWTPLSPATAPPARYGASMTADSVTATDVLFGGLAAPGQPLNDTWSWDGTNWTSNTPTSNTATPNAATPNTATSSVAALLPPSRSGAAMTFDAARGVVVLFGGTTGSTNLADTWTWDGTAWSPSTVPTSPPARSDAAFGFDPATQTAVLFAGSGAGGATLRDTWLWNGSTWSTSLPLSLLPTLSPPARVGASVASDPGDQRLVLFGGSSGGSDALNDTWKVATLVTAPQAHPSTTVASGPTTRPAGATTSTTSGGSTSTTTAPSPPTTRAAAVRAPLVVAASSVQQGDPVRVSGSGFVPGAKITITLHSANVVVGTTFADAEGRFSTTVVVPTDLPPGPHHIEAAGTAMTGGQAVLVAQVSITAQGAKQSWLLPAFMVALTVLLATGAGAVFTASNRWHGRPGH